jgi:hypothetical protein
MTDLTEIIADWRKNGTPGPWATAGRYWIWVVAGKLHIATIARAGDGDWNPGNGALIAAAPDMADRIKALEAENARLREALTAITTGSLHPVELIAKARAALNGDNT